MSRGLCGGLQVFIGRLVNSTHHVARPPPDLLVDAPHVLTDHADAHHEILVRRDGDGPVVLIEVQTGDYLGEDDIERAEDDYGRV